jgi:hypothetical protein
LSRGTNCDLVHLCFFTDNFHDFFIPFSNFLVPFQLEIKEIMAQASMDDELVIKRATKQD